ncbi:hypothetical protein BpHYR1_034210 [Brachionus plicatilis]|uniref:Uncharacterized protein n=1 Tax=Brachionus plicatilis TaxID=10195 RepID=A0A3M7SLW6_BRAPC|nr:hypothetical protein BpHYR1_034210 [Brachionus plicatilis]
MSVIFALRLDDLSLKYFNLKYYQTNLSVDYTITYFLPIEVKLKNSLSFISIFRYKSFYFNNLKCDLQNQLLNIEELFNFQFRKLVSDVLFNYIKKA